MRFSLSSLIPAALCLCGAAPILHAQAITATVVGSVTDPSGAAVPAATVNIANKQTGVQRSTTSDSAGSYTFTFLNPGSWAVTVEAKGFQKSETGTFQLSVDQVARVDVRMTIGQATETVQVAAGAVLLQTEDAAVGTVINSQQVVELPLNGRSFVQLALLTPGVNPGTPGSITVRRLRGSVGQDVGMSANGARDTQNRFYYDGIEAMDLDSYSFSFSPSIDAISEFKVQSSTYSAEVGGAPGGQVNLTTKSGTNQLHGRAWEFQPQRQVHRAERLPTARSGRQAAAPQSQPVRRQPRRTGLHSQALQRQGPDVLLRQLGIGPPDRRVIRGGKRWFLQLPKGVETFPA